MRATTAPEATRELPWLVAVVDGDDDFRAITAREETRCKWLPKNLTLCSRQIKSVEKMPPPPMRPLARVCRPYLLGRSAICLHPNLDKDEAPATTIHLRSATPLTLRARGLLCHHQQLRPSEIQQEGERGGEVSLLLWCPSLTPSHRGPSQR